MSHRKGVARQGSVVFLAVGDHVRPVTDRSIGRTARPNDRAGEDWRRRYGHALEATTLISAACTQDVLTKPRRNRRGARFCGTTGSSRYWSPDELGLEFIEQGSRAMPPGPALLGNDATMQRRVVVLRIRGAGRSELLARRCGWRVLLRWPWESSAHNRARTCMHVCMYSVRHDRWRARPTRSGGRHPPAVAGHHGCLLGGAGVRGDHWPCRSRASWLVAGRPAPPLRHTRPDGRGGG